MRLWHKAFVAICLALLVLVDLRAAKRKVSETAVQKVHRAALLIDTHNDVTSFTVEGFDLGTAGSKHHTDLPRLKAGGVGAVFFAAYVGPEYAASRTSAFRALQMIDTIRTDIVARHPSNFVLAQSAADIESAHKHGRIAALIGVEGGHAIEDSLRLLRDFYALGVRYMTLTHSNTNNWADSSGDIDKPEIKHHNGLTDFGKQVIAEMNRLGMIVDVSHVSDKTFRDALETSRAPLFASHSSCRALCDVGRNMTDEMIVAMAKKGGVVQINFYSGFLAQRSADADRLAEVAKSGKDMPALPPAGLEDVVAHINHVVKIAGIEAVGIGSDFDGIKSVPTGLEDVSKFPNLTRALLEEGYSASDVRKIYGGNTLRVMRAVERVARELKTAGKRGLLCMGLSEENPFLGGVAGAAMTIAERQRSQSQTGWVAVSKFTTYPKAWRPLPPKRGFTFFKSRTSPPLE